MNELGLYLKSLGLFGENELEDPLRYFKETKIAKNEFYVKEDEVCTRAAFVKKGLFRLYYTLDGVEKIMLFFQENQFVTDYYSFLTRTPSKRPVQALEDSVVYSISYNDFQELFEKSRKWERLGRVLAERAYIYSVQRANRIIHDSPDTRFITFLKEYPTLIQRVPQFMIASYLNMTPETFSRIKKRIDYKEIEKFSSVHDPLKKNFI